MAYEEREEGREVHGWPMRRGRRGGIYTGGEGGGEVYTQVAYEEREEGRYIHRWPMRRGRRGGTRVAYEEREEGRYIHRWPMRRGRRGGIYTVVAQKPYKSKRRA